MFIAALFYQTKYKIIFTQLFNFNFILYDDAFWYVYREDLFQRAS